jgi:ABC-2 type transport system permease protein
MTAITTQLSVTAPATRQSTQRPGAWSAWRSLVRRRFSLSAHSPREILAPMATPLLFALVLAPALAHLIPTAGPGGVDYRTYVIIGTVGLLIPLACTFAGIGVIVDRTSGAQRELLAAPIARSLVVMGNLAVAATFAVIQVAVLMAAGALRGAQFHVVAGGIAWFAATVLVFTVFMYALAEVLANRIPTQEEYVGLTPVVAIVPWFLAGSLFPISPMPAWLTALAKVLPLTHALALLRYGVLDPRGAGLHQIWGLASPSAEATLSMAVLLAWAALLTLAALAVFRRAAVQ